MRLFPIAVQLRHREEGDVAHDADLGHTLVSMITVSSITVSVMNISISIRIRIRSSISININSSSVIMLFKASLI